MQEWSKNGFKANLWKKKKRWLTRNYKFCAWIVSGEHDCAIVTKYLYGIYDFFFYLSASRNLKKVFYVIVMYLNHISGAQQCGFAISTLGTVTNKSHFVRR